MDWDPIKVPGYGLPVYHEDLEERFPNAIRDWSATPLTLRELTMIDLMNKITDKEGWERKVMDDTYAQKWRQEALGAAGMDVSDKMFDWIIAELRDKAQAFRRTGVISSLDLEAAVIKSDTIITPELKKDLRAACAPLNDIPDRLKDWHPGSDDKVLDLVHPSLFPLVYGRSRVLPSGSVGLKDCVDFTGKGEIVKPPAEREVASGSVISGYAVHRKLWSKDFQWLPCDVAFVEENNVKIMSYINNLHPKHNSTLYPVIEKFIAKSVPLWDETLSSVMAAWEREPRIGMGCTQYEFPEGETPEGDTPEEDAPEGETLTATRVLVMPEPGEYKPFVPSDDKKVSLRDQFAENGLQVIVKLASIELNPEKPEYEGGSWHIEGQLNEHICASALYYYDSENITDSFLAFRHQIDADTLGDKAYGQDDYEGVEELYGVRQHGAAIQDIGRILTREGRLLAFPNVVQHRVSSFRLDDHTRTGHRKILALFLVDPHIRILSTANVPPQQRSWWAEKVRENGRLGEMPTELVDSIIDNVSDFPISLEEAKEIRLKLMDERKAFVKDVDQHLEETVFAFCEH